MNSRAMAAMLFVLASAGCAEMRPEAALPTEGHLSAASPAAGPAIPDVVQQTPFVPPPSAVPESERYTVVVNDVPVRELLFALARDAELNIDIAGEVSGNVTLNAIDQTLPQILERIARQVALRYELDRDTIVITPDVPYLRTYDVGYVNLSRDADTTVNVATRVATTGGGSVEETGGSGGSSGGGNNTSSTRLNSRSYNRFWETLYTNVLSILGQNAPSGGASETSSDVIPNAEAGLLTVKATSTQHRMIEDFIDKVLVNARRQVMIETTIVEVSLNDQYQAGVDWSYLLRTGKSGFNVDQNLLGQITDGVIDNSLSSFTAGYFDPRLGGNVLDVSVRLLREFGDTRVLSSPRLMVLNNQTAILKVVEELVYFTIDVTDKDSTATSQGRTIIESEVHSVPVGLVMAVTPQISPNSEVTLTVRPTISQRIGDVVDPATQLAAQFIGAGAQDITSTVPVIRVREMESVLKLVDGQIAVLGGLMQDELRSGDREVPGFAKLPILGELFFDTEELQARKTELVIFLRPVVVRDPSVNTDLEGYRGFLGGGSPASP